MAYYESGDEPATDVFWHRESLPEAAYPATTPFLPDDEQSPDSSGEDVR